MIISNLKNNKKKVFISLIFLTLVLPLSLIMLSKNIFSTPPSSAGFISPLADKKDINNQNGQKKYSLEYYLNLCQSFSAKATRLANDNPHQTELDKIKIINTLNQALKAINQAIEYYPDRPEAYLTRAQLYQKVKSIWPEKKAQAERDLAIANKLMEKTGSHQGKSDISAFQAEIKKSNPLNFIPTKKANLAQNLIIAEPKSETKASNSESQVDTNALSGFGILPAGETEVIIRTPKLNNNSQVYLVPKGDINNIVLYVKAKKEGQWFKAGVDQASNQDIKFKWWIINK